MLLQILTEAVGAADAVEQLADVAVQTQEKIPVMQLALKGGWIMIPIILLLLVSVYVFVERLVVIRKSSGNEEGLLFSIRDYVLNDRLDSAKTLCMNTGTPTARIIEKGIDRIGKPIENIKSAMEDAGNLEVARLEKGISWLSTAAGAAPMIGFLGTVTGMVRVFFDMASKGNNIEVGTLANGMYQAMVTTVAGLIVGIIAYICYNIVVSRIGRATHVFEARSSEFMDLLNEPVK
ncbi:MAG: MotA/TolQ/ExbB proton channel family protein [Bacteroidales bacterium]|nr:MotA/TolQ/ExbB proton channel family protein [Bacteroidales bacterium]MDE7071973.1 MotA/TolQ/ExbB proton channel family protein [Bacteroidales bacterium]